MNKKFNLVWLIWNIVEVLIIFAAAALCLTYAYGPSERWIAVTILCLVGAIIVLSGSLRLGILIFGGRKLDASGIAIRSLQIAAGLTLITVDFEVSINLAFWFVSLLLLVIGVVLMCLGIMKIIEAKRANMISVINFIIAAILVAAGIVFTVICMKIYVSKKWTLGSEAILAILGIIAIIYGIAKCASTIFITVKANKTGESVIDIISQPKEKKYDIDSKTPVEEVEPMEEDREPIKPDPTIKK